MSLHGDRDTTFESARTDTPDATGTEWAGFLNAAGELTVKKV
jgi:hypothetical protein